METIIFCLMLDSGIINPQLPNPYRSSVTTRSGFFAIHTEDIWVYDQNMCK